MALNTIPMTYDEQGYPDKIVLTLTGFEPGTPQTWGDQFTTALPSR